MSNIKKNFEQFMNQRDNAANAFVNGDPAPLESLAASTSPATFFGPRGGYEQGPDQVSATYRRDGTRFSAGHSRFEILHMAASDGLAYWVGFQQATTHMDGNPEATPFNLRVTEVFRKEGDEWKLIHRHADAMASPPGQ